MNSLITIDTVKQDEEIFTKEIITSKGANLPSRLEDVIDVFEFTDFKAKAWKILASKMSKLEEQSELYESAQRSGRQWGIASLYAQKRIGEITRDMPNGRGKTKMNSNGNNSFKIDALKEKGISPQRTSQSEQIANNPEVLDRVVESGEKDIEIPTKAEVFNAIRIKKLKENNQKAKVKSDKKTAKEKTQAVKDYYDSIKGFEHSLDSAIISAEYGDFSTEGINFMVKKHDKIINKLNKLLEVLECQKN
ncbi:MAG: hypothetical protein GY853_06705 [PVC group bacterium]|nr:hypothetical protein [PVC group bacterium]